jgi:uncharacterized damage-inducible protein DinB
MSTSDTSEAAFMTPSQVLNHWQTHRRLTRRLIEKFPEDQLFTFSIGGMRTFGALANEIIGMAVPTAKGVATNDWSSYAESKATSRSEVLAAWDKNTEELNAAWATIPAARFHETMTAFGQWTMPGNDLVMYVIDNEIHHRGQGYVYLRALNIEPPAFWERT